MGASFRTSLSRFRSHDGQLRLSWSARSTLSSNKIRAASDELRAGSDQYIGSFKAPLARSSKLQNMSSGSFR